MRAGRDHGAGAAWGGAAGIPAESRISTRGDWPVGIDSVDGKRTQPVDARLRKGMRVRTKAAASMPEACRAQEGRG